MRPFDAAFALRLSYSVHLVTASSSQEPLLGHQLEIHRQEGDRDWDLNFSSAAPHYLASLHGLLKQWPNTFFPNGHSIVPCEVPAFTNLYHGRMDGELPPSPEWLSFDM
jgi:hypothetical protein